MYEIECMCMVDLVYKCISGEVYCIVLVVGINSWMVKIDGEI